MPKFSLTLTRNATESVTVEIEADTIKEAHEEALGCPPVDGWEVDDNEHDAYLPDPDDYYEN